LIWADKRKAVDTELEKGHGWTGGGRQGRHECAVANSAFIDSFVDDVFSKNLKFDLPFKVKSVKSDGRRKGQARLLESKMEWLIKVEIDACVIALGYEVQGMLSPLGPPE
jgi:hypothetical protein